MSFKKCYLKDIIGLRNELKSMGLEYFIEKYSKCDSIIGSSDSSNFIDNILKKHLKKSFQ